MSDSPKKIMLLTGESSGDHHGAQLIKQCLSLEKNLVFYGIGGSHLRDVGMEIFLDIKDLSFFGITDILMNFRKIFRAMNVVKKQLLENRPDLLILIDNPGFNLRIAEFAKKQGIRVLYYISPKIWASRPGRIKKMEKTIDHMAVIFPFELECYRNTTLKATYVGNPLLQQVVPTKTPAELRSELNLDPNMNNPLVGLLPGSRRSEIKHLMPVILESAKKIHERLPHVQFLLPLADTIPEELINPYLEDFELPIKVVRHQTYNVIHACRALIICSGTATLEAALLKTPMVVIYKLNILTALIGAIIVKTPFIALCNIVAGKKIVKEFIQFSANAKNISQEIIHLLTSDTYRDYMIRDLEAMKQKMTLPENEKALGRLVLQSLP